MPRKPLARCPSCKRRHAGSGLCSSCKARRDDRPSAAARGYGRDHRDRFRAGVLDRDPVCACPGCRRCLAGMGRACCRPATRADHWPLARRDLVAAGADPDDPRHGRGLCGSCDSAQTARRQPGGFNRRPSAS